MTVEAAFPMGVYRITGRWLFPGDGSPIERGLVEITDGVISDISQRRGPADERTLDLGNAAILPGLINAHAHLEFSDLTEPIQPPRPMKEWIRSLLQHRSERTQTLHELIHSGAEEAAGTGTAIVGDIVTGEFAVSSDRKLGPTIVSFRELIGFLPEQAAAQIETASRHVALCRAASTSGPAKLIPAISPHAPYSVSPDLFHASIELAAAENLPLCMHLAETKSELELLAYGTGEFVEMLKSFGIWREGVISKGTRPIDYLKPLAKVDHALIAHGNYFSDCEVAWLGQHESVATVYCPRTHAFFEHDQHPWLQLLESGATVCLGTDGRSSNPDYSMWSEMQFLDKQTDGRRRPTILELATRNGAQALGLADEYGTITPAKQSAFCIVDLPMQDCSDPWTLLFSPETRARGVNVTPTLSAQRD